MKKEKKLEAIAHDCVSLSGLNRNTQTRRSDSGKYVKETVKQTPLKAIIAP